VTLFSCRRETTGGEGQDHFGNDHQIGAHISTAPEGASLSDGAAMARSTARSNVAPSSITSSLALRFRLAPEGGTVNRPRTHLSYRKQTVGYTQGRNFPVHFLVLFLVRFLRVNRACLPGTVTRVETHLSHRKQTTAHASTRNVPAHQSFRVLFAREDPLARAAEMRLGLADPKAKTPNWSLALPGKSPARRSVDSSSSAEIAALEP